MDLKVELLMPLESSSPKITDRKGRVSKTETAAQIL